MRNPDLQYLDEASTIDDLGSRALLLLMKSAGIRENLHSALKLRFRWAGGSAQSLARVGEEANLTRERIRQLQRKIDGQTLDLSCSAPNLLRSAERCHSRPGRISVLARLRR